MKKKLLFTAYNLDIGGIETSLVNLLNYIDYNKYEVVLILEKKEGIFLNEINKNVIIKEVKVSSCKFVPVRKMINYFRKLKFKLKNKNKYDFSCCYATYSYSGNVLALIASTNSMIYIHSNYIQSFKNDINKIKEFFDTRNLDKFKYINFVSKESLKDFKKYYSEYDKKLTVFNNFIDIDKILELGREKIIEKKPKDKKLFVFVGRLDDSSKKLERAFDIVKSIDNIELWVVGDGPDKGLYQKMVNEKEIKDRVLFLGKKKNPYPYISIADYIILTSDYEGFPVIYLESLAFNKSIITTIPVSDDKLDFSKIAFIISKEKSQMIKDVKNILNSKKKLDKISIKESQNERMKELEKIFDGKN